MKIIKAYFLLLWFLPLFYFAQNKNGTGHSPQNLPPDVHFSWNHSCAGDTTCFTNQTQMGNTYTWTVVGGPGHPHTLYTTNDTNMCYFFSMPGIYTVSLHAYNNHDVTLDEVITIDTITKADFEFIRCADIFANHSFCATSFHWDFGDGNTSALFTPIHQYADTGHYTVTLISYNGTKSDTITKQIFVDVPSFANALFTYITSYDTVFVHANFSGYSANYYWNFNDPVNPLTSLGTGRDTLHIYSDSTAKYDISLTVVNLCGPKFSSDSAQVISLKLPSALSFTSNLAIIPNPVENGELNVFYNSLITGDFLVTVYDPLGRIIVQEYFTFLPGINGFKIPTPNFLSGVYVLSLLSQNNYTRRKFIIK